MEQRARSIVGDRFEIERVVGSGGMGYVYRAHDRLTGQPVALKLLRDVGYGEHARRFLNELELQATLQHPAIVRYVAHGFGGSAADEPYLALEWLDGHTLDDHLLRQLPSIQQTMALARRVAVALGFVHRRGVVHRDIKPGNLFLVGGDPEAAKLLDFGVARVRGSNMTRTGMVLGTIRYMAPEQVGSGAIGPHTDVFSLGLVLFECLTGQPPFDASNMRYVSKVQFEDVPSVRELRPDVPEPIAELVAKMVTRDPAKRLADGDAVVRAIDALGDATWDTSPSPQRAAALTAVEQRLVTIVLVQESGADAVAATVAKDAATLVDATPASFDPARESVDAVRRIREIASSRGARCDLLRDGTILVVPPSLGTPSRQVAAAAQCALEVRSALPSARVVIATGRTHQTDRVVVGAVIERAARDLRQRAAGGPWLDTASLALLDRNRFEVDDASGQLLGTRLAEPNGAFETPFVGRRREMRTLAGLLDDMRDEETACVAVVTGAPGLGKSRLIAEFAAAAAPEVATVLKVACDPVRAGSAFGALSMLVARAADLPDRAGPAARRAKLRAYLDGLLGDEAATTALFLAEVIRAPYDDAANEALRAARVSGELMHQRIRAAVLAWLGALIARGPALVIIEDLHWGDAPSVDLLDAALRSLDSRPWMLVATGRPDVDRVFPDLWKRRSPQQLVLAELPEKAAAELAGELVGDGADAQLTRRLVERAGGNPYLLQEMARAVRAGWKEAGGDRAPILTALPDSILGMVQATLDVLDPNERLVLRAASIFGQVFWKEGVQALLPPALARDLDGWLESLERREIVERRADSRIDDASELRIRQEIVRATAYGTLTDADRELGHRIAGDWLEAHGETDPVVLANHFAQGARADQAARNYLAAALNARAGGDTTGAFNVLSAGLACAPEGHVRGELHALAAALANYAMRFEEAREHGRSAMQMLAAGSRGWFLAGAEITNSVTRLGDIAGLEDMGRLLLETRGDGDAVSARAFAMAHTARALLGWERFGELADALIREIDLMDDGSVDAYAMPRIHELRARVRERRGEPGGLIEELRRAIAAAERVADMQQAVQLASHLGTALRDNGWFEEAIRVLERCAVGLPADQKLLRTYVHLQIALAYTELGDHARGWQRMEIGLDGVKEMGGRYRAIAGAHAARMKLLAGDLDEAERYARFGLEGAGDQLLSWRVPLLAELAAMQLRRGRVAEAVELVREYLADVLRRDVHVFHEPMVWLVTASVLETAGEEAQLTELLGVAVEELARRAASFSSDDERAHYLGMAEHVKVREMAAARRIGS